MEMCGGESVKDWEGLGKSLSIPEAKLEEISLTHKEDVEKSKEHLFKVCTYGLLDVNKNTIFNHNQGKIITCFS